MIKHVIMTEEEAFLDSFFQDEIYFLAHKEVQLEYWSEARGELHFATFLMRFFQDWRMIVKYKNDHKFLPGQFEELQKLHEMIDKFQKTDFLYPTHPMDYRRMLNHPEWNNIREKANRIYNDYRSKMKFRTLN